MEGDVPCSVTVRIVAVCAVEGPGSSVSWVASDRAFILDCVLSAKQIFSNSRLFLLHSSKVLQDSKFINLSLGSGGLGGVSVALAKSLLRITVFFYSDYRLLQCGMYSL